MLGEPSRTIRDETEERDLCTAENVLVGPVHADSLLGVVFVLHRRQVNDARRSN